MNFLQSPLIYPLRNTITHLNLFSSPKTRILTLHRLPPHHFIVPLDAPISVALTCGFLFHYNGTFRDKHLITSRISDRKILASTSAEMSHYEIAEQTF